MKRELIGSLPLFEGLTVEDVEILARSFEHRAYPASSVLFAQGDPADRLYVLTSGRVAIQFKPYDGDILPVTEVDAGGVFGWSAALDRPSYTSCAVALEDSEAVSISGEELRRLCESNPRMGVIIIERLAEVIAARLKSTHAKVMDMLQQGMRPTAQG